MSSHRGPSSPPPSIRLCKAFFFFLKTWARAAVFKQSHLFFFLYLFNFHDKRPPYTGRGVVVEERLKNA